MAADELTPKAWIDGLPEERRSAIRKIRAVIRKRLPKGYAESMRWGMLTYEVPLKTQPDTYNGQPLMYAALGSSKGHMTLYLMGVYAHEPTKELVTDAWKASGKRLDMGKSCLRFKTLDDVPLDVVGDAIAAFEVDEFIALVSPD